MPHVYLTSREYGNALGKATWPKLDRRDFIFDKAVLWRNRALQRKLSRPALARLEWMIWYERHDRDASLTARHYGISPKTFWKWKKRFNERDFSTLEERSRAPLRTRVRTITQQEEVRIVDLRREHLRWGKEKIALSYRERWREPMSAWKVQKVIEKYRLYYHPAKNARTQAKRRRAQKKKRIAELSLKRRTGFLFRIDTVVRYWHGTKRYILTAIDNTSKIAFAHMYTTHSSRAAADFLCRLYLLTNGKIENIQTDNGSEFHAEFDEACRKLTIPHYWSRVKTPKDNAANERFNRTLQDEFIAMGHMTIDPDAFNRELTEWIIEYNFKRPHQALGYSTPINFAYKRSPSLVLPMSPSSTLHCAFTQTWYTSCTNGFGLPPPKRRGRIFFTRQFTKLAETTAVASERYTSSSSMQILFVRRLRSMNRTCERTATASRCPILPIGR
jgi:transposase InsO family protein